MNERQRPGRPAVPPAAGYALCIGDMLRMPERSPRGTGPCPRALKACVCIHHAAGFPDATAGSAVTETEKTVKRREMPQNPVAASPRQGNVTPLRLAEQGSLPARHLPSPRKCRDV